jgi:hypothetical protein
MSLRGWRILSKKSKDLLGSQTPLIRKVKIQNKGDYSRFYSDTVTEKAGTNALCGLLTGRGIKFFVTELAPS